jgi:hypothetical protein
MPPVPTLSARRCRWPASLSESIPLWAAGSADRRSLYAAPALQRRFAGVSAGIVIAGGPAPLIATALFASYHSGYAILIYIAACAMVSLVETAMMPDYTGQDISMMMTDNLAVVLADR